MNSGIYLIINQTNHKIYVGKAVKGNTRASGGKGVKKTAEHKQKIALGRLGKKHSAATRAKMSASQQRRRDGSV